MPRPNFFIVGAPKCGTTALYHCLRRHPDVFMPHSEDPDLYWIYKEPHHFCPDLGLPSWLRVEAESDYLALFDAATGQRRLGSAAALNLMSEEAARRIHAFTGGEGRVIIMLRSPVRWMRSWHHDMLRHDYEDISDFREALEAEPARARGERLPRRPAFAGCLGYRRGARFTEQIRRYLNLFPRERLFIGLMDDMNADPRGFVTAVLEFLGVDADEIPKLGRENESGVLPGSHRFDLAVGRALARLPGAGLARRLFDGLPRKAYRGVVDRILPPLSDKSIEPVLAAELEEEFRPEIDALEELLGRELPW